MTTLSPGLVDPAEIKDLTGLELFQGFIAGRFPPPPLTGNIPMRVIEVEYGVCIWETEAPDWFLNPMGTVHGGYAMAVLDSALGCSVHTALDVGEAYTTIEAKVNMTRPIPRGVTLRCEGRMITKGRRTATSEAKLFSPEGKVLAFGTSSLMIFSA